MSKLVMDVERCKGCGLCIKFCPRKALVSSDTLNRRGYRIPRAVAADCVQCGICYSVCPDNVFELLPVWEGDNV